MQTIGGRRKLASFQTIRIILLSAPFLKCSSWLLSSMLCVLLPLWLTISAPSADVFVSSFWAFKLILRDSIKPSYLQKLSPRPHTSFSPLTSLVYDNFYDCVCVCVLSCSVISDSLRTMDCSPPGSSVYGIFQERILEWVAISSPGDLPDPGIKSTFLASPALAGGFFTMSATWEAQDCIYMVLNMCRYFSKSLTWLFSCNLQNDSKN